MHLLFLTPSLPYPPHQGGAIRNYGLIHGLHQAGHTITLLSYTDGGIRPEDTPLAEICEHIVTVAPPDRTMSKRLRDLLTSSTPDLALRLYSKGYAAKLQECLHDNTFDLVQLEGLEVAAYLPLIRQHSQAAICYDAHNAEYRLQQAIYEVDRHTPRRWPAALYSLIQARRIADFEQQLCQQVDLVTAVSDEDAAALRPFRASQTIQVVPNGIFAADYEQAQDQLALGQHVLTFTGKMDYRPNVDAMLRFSEAVLPAIQREVSDVRLYIVGQKPHPRLAPLRDNPHIEITGWVPEVLPYLQATTVYVAPLRMGSGTRLKLLEAMAAGCAVVATTVAASGLPDSAKDAMIVIDAMDDIAAEITRLLRDTTRRAQLGAQARAFVHQHYDWSLIVPRLLAAYKEIGLG